MEQEIDCVFDCLPKGDFWVFGYGSLMWNPGFTYQDKQAGVLHGYKRSLCVWSWHHRGTKDAPGLVFGLDKVDNSKSCHGCAYLVSGEHRAEALRYLKERELITDIYQVAVLPISISDGEVMALTFIVDSSSEQYAGQQDAATCAKVIAYAKGNSGPNTDYVLETWSYLQNSNIPDEELKQVASLL